jgi:polyphosphate:AMP phosphotransferase
MLKTVNLDEKIPKEERKSILKSLDLELGQAQRDLRPHGSPIIIVIEGWDAAGKGVVLNRLLETLDPRGFSVYAVNRPSKDERMFPPMRRYWLRIPGRGYIVVFNHSWYQDVLEERVEDGMSKRALQAAYERIRTFERQLDDGGTVFLKLFLHISKKEQAIRFKALRSDPAYAWKVGKDERRRHKLYAEYYRATEELLEETSTAYAPWTVISGTDADSAAVRVKEAMHAAFRRALARANQPAGERANPPARHAGPLDGIDMNKRVSKKEYDKRLPVLQEKLRRLQHRCYIERRPVAIVYEGWDAAGKGGNIKRLTWRLDPRGYDVEPTSAPHGEEKEHHYLWRFWRTVPKAGHIQIYDRSWYGRVLVERVEGFANREEWERAYREINEFEAQLVESGIVLIKFWIHITKEEQLDRFKQRDSEPHKKWKLTAEDWRNREKWDDYQGPVVEMLERTSTTRAPWTIIEGNNKQYARLRTLDVVIERLSAAMNGKG